MVNGKIGKYKVVRLIGEGGMASVYEGEHDMLGTKVAIKILNPVLSANTQIRERFRNEAKLMASLDHPNIIKVIDFDEQTSQLSIIMEFLTGEDLNHVIKRTGPMPDDRIREIFLQTLSAFQYAHQKGIVHRDIKPSNIFILPNGHVKILDFGIAKLFGQGNEMTQAGTQIGTPVFMSPEQVKTDRSIDHRSDIYSLGVTLFYAINGKAPYNSDDTSQFDIFSKIVYEPLPRLNRNSVFEQIIAKACNKDRELRFQSCEEWLETLTRMDQPAAPAKEQGYASSSPVTEVKKTMTHDVGEMEHVVQTKPKSKTKKRLIWISAITLLLILLLSTGNNESELVKKGVGFFNAENYEKAFQTFNSEELKNNPDAQYYLARMYTNGQHTPKDSSKAFELAQKSADQKNVAAINLLGNLYESGIGTPVDMNKAKDNFNRAYGLGNFHAAYNLGRLHFVGTFEEGKKDYIKSLQYLNDAMDRKPENLNDIYIGYPEMLAGYIYIEGGAGVLADKKKGKELMLKAIEMKNSKAASLLGDLYKEGNVLPKDLGQAFQYYSKSAELHDKDGQYKLATMYLNGEGCKKDPKKAFELFSQSAEQKHAPSIAALGYMHEFNLGGAGYDLKKARAYYQQAADMGDEWAKQKLR